ncbi:FAD-dependent oxidoreductase [Rhodoferax sediminis]|uniref:FAD/NAD(P)-binding domain-containing protein n=1 Tax=Rhodoferax sediminis TaxID=2509614 RepID=A0A515D9L4_9BURK|nr:FAD-dependent oxidoreductase [Rhodoferax sediminis]QDL37086.1 hypothetical protein EUB48_07145 [Rhodoferax sediminis]
MLSSSVPGRRESLAPCVFINVGGRAAGPDLAGVNDVPHLDNASFMELTEVPDHMVIVGGSSIGIEFAQMMRRFDA